MHQFASELASDVFDEVAFDYLAYNPFLSEFCILDFYQVECGEGRVVGLVNEIGETPKKIIFQVKVLSCI